MDAKLNQSDLISLLAKGSNISIAKAEQFTKNFFDLIIEGLEKDGIVKINGLGTFKITDVASRGSVNVNTGEKIEIKGHKKLTFTPADALKDSVNQPFAMFEPVEVDDTYQPEPTADINNDDIADAVELSENVEDTTEDSVDVVETTEPAEDVEDAVVTVEKESTEVEEAAEVVANAETADEENHSTEIEEQSVEGEIAEPENATEPENDDTSKEPEEQREPVAVKKKSKWSVAIFLILGFVIGFVAVKMLERDGGSDAEETATDSNAKTTMVADCVNEPAVADNKTTASIDTLAVVADDSATATGEPEQPAESTQVEEEAPEVYTFVMVEELAAIKLKEISMADTLLYVADGELARHTVAADETLVRIAQKYFGDKKLWPYIVKYNKMHNPNGLRNGMEISIPRLIPKK